MEHIDATEKGERIMFDLIIMAVAIFLGLTLYSVAVFAIFMNKKFMKRYIRTVMDVSKEVTEEIMNITIEQHERNQFTEVM